MMDQKRDPHSDNELIEGELPTPTQGGSSAGTGTRRAFSRILIRRPSRVRAAQSTFSSIPFCCRYSFSAPSKGYSRNGCSADSSSPVKPNMCAAASLQRNTSPSSVASTIPAELNRDNS